MGLDSIVNNEEEQTSDKQGEPKIENVTLSLGAWRYILSQTKCHIPINENSMELWEVEEIINLINFELRQKRPFGKKPEDLPTKHMKRYRDKMEETLEEMKE